MKTEEELIELLNRKEKAKNKKKRKKANKDKREILYGTRDFSERKYR